jgi:hypothetical protein
MLNYSLLFFIYIILVIWLGLINIVITEKIIQNPSHLLYKQRINYEKLLLLIKRKFALALATYQISKTDIQKSPMPSYNTLGPLRWKDSPHVWVSAWSWQPLCTISISSEFLREVGNLFAPSVSRTAASSVSD